MAKLFISPHNDDETLFGAYTIMRTRPIIVVVYDSEIQVRRGHEECDWRTRRNETLKGVYELLGPGADVRFCGLSDDKEYGVDRIFSEISRVVPEHIGELYAPAYEMGGHQQHNLVSLAAEKFSRFGRRYSTYVTGPSGGRTKTNDKVPPIDGTYITRKLKALACYRTQIEIAELGCWPWFAAGLEEYYL